MSNVKEINLGYVDHVRSLNEGVNRSTNDATTRPSLRLRFGLWRYRVLNTVVLPALMSVGVISLGLALAVWLRLVLLLKRHKSSPFTDSALGCVDEFLAQYPFHLYPIVCKAFELACLDEHIPGLLKQHNRFVEIAIGEGTLSS